MVKAPLVQRLRCLLTGHEWRRGVNGQGLSHLRCHRCWVAREVDDRIALDPAVEPEATEIQGDRWAPST